MVARYPAAPRCLRGMEPSRKENFSLGLTEERGSFSPELWAGSLGLPGLIPSAAAGVAGVSRAPQESQRPCLPGAGHLDEVLGINPHPPPPPPISPLLPFSRSLGHQASDNTWKALSAREHPPAKARQPAPR